jgi:predicted DNA-binding transcriptional regulator YafY
VSKIERLLNLLVLLLNTERLLTAAEIRQKLAGYHDQSDEAFHRKFERDKTEIRGLGYVIEQEDADPWGADPGYRISADRTLLDDPGLTAEEVAALSLAAQAWGGSAGDGAIGLAKLSVDTGRVDAGQAGFLLPRLSVDRTLTTLIDAVGRRKTVTFSYRTGGAGTPQRRTVDPHGLYHRGVWYLAGFDRDRGEVRNFKVTRMAGPVQMGSGREPDFDEPPRAAPDIPRGPWDGERRTEAVLALAPDVGWWAERRTGATRLTEREDTWIEVSIQVSDEEAFVRWVAGFRDRAEVLAPPALRAAVVAHLRAILEAD